MDSSGVAGKLIENLSKIERKSYDMIAATLINGNQTEINRQCLNHPSTYAFYAGILATAKYKVNISEHTLDQYYSERYLAIKEEIGGDKGVTETFIKQKINTDEKYQTLKLNLYRFQQEEGILSAIVKSLEHKKDMLFSLASNFRAEIKSGISVNENDESGIAKSIRKDK